MMLIKQNWISKLSLHLEHGEGAVKGLTVWFPYNKDGNYIPPLSSVPTPNRPTRKPKSRDTGCSCVFEHLPTLCKPVPGFSLFTKKKQRCGTGQQRWGVRSKDHRASLRSSLPTSALWIIWRGEDGLPLAGAEVLIFHLRSFVISRQSLLPRTSSKGTWATGAMLELSHLHSAAQSLKKENNTPLSLCVFHNFMPP